MKLLKLLFLLLLASGAGAQTIKNNQIIMGMVDSVWSKILNENRKVWIYVPAGAGNATYTKLRYPVVYLLDGDGHFPSVAGMIQQLSEVNGNMVCPDMIVVGIPNTDRTRDLTPTNALYGPDGKKQEDFKNSGGGEKFTAFIQKELMPRIDSLYPTAPYKILIGHSFGGLTAMYIFTNHTDMFNAYVVIDPSMWWDQKKLLKQTEQALSQKKYTGKELFLGIANTMPLGMDTARVRKDTTGNTAHIRSILELKDALSHNRNNGLKFSYNYYKKDSHSSVPLIAEYDALHFLFSNYALPQDMANKLYDPDSKLNVADLLAKHYQNLSKQFGYTILPPEGTINELGYYFMQNGHAGKAYPLFVLNVQNYPASPNAYDSMGDYYAFKKDKSKAIEFYNKTLKLTEAKETREKLNKLLADKK